MWGAPRTTAVGGPETATLDPLCRLEPAGSTEAPDRVTDGVLAVLGLELELKQAGL